MPSERVAGIFSHRCQQRRRVLVYVLTVDKSHQGLATHHLLQILLNSFRPCPKLDVAKPWWNAVKTRDDQFSTSLNLLVYVKFHRSWKLMRCLVQPRSSCSYSPPSFFNSQISRGLVLRSNRISRRATLPSVLTDVCLTPRFMLDLFCRFCFTVAERLDDVQLDVKADA